MQSNTRRRALLTVSGAGRRLRPRSAFTRKALLPLQRQSSASRLREALLPLQRQSSAIQLIPTMEALLPLQRQSSASRSREALLQRQSSASRLREALLPLRLPSLLLAATRWKAAAFESSRYRLRCDSFRTRLTHTHTGICGGADECAGAAAR